MVRETGTSLNPVLRIYRPDGSVLCTAGFAGSGGDVANVCALDASGTHMVLAGDWSGVPYAGDYSLSVQRTNSPAGATGIVYGQTLSGNIRSEERRVGKDFSGTAGGRAF